MAQLRPDGPPQAAPLATRVRQRHVLFDCQILAGTRHRVLKHPCYPQGALPYRLARDILAIDEDAAGIDGDVA